MAEEQKKGNSIPVSMNTFYKGMNQDIAKYAMPSDQYYDANNIRVVANSGQEGAAMVNIEGNDFLVEIPNSPAVFELRLVSDTNLIAVPWSLTVQFNVGTWGLFAITITGTGGNPIRDLVRTLEDITAGVWTITGVPMLTPPSNLPDGLPGFYWIFDESSNRLVLWGKPEQADFSQYPSSSQIGTFNVQQVSNPQLTMPITGSFLTVSNLAVAQSGLSIIGYTPLRDFIYLFTTNILAEPGGPGQIWKLYVDPTISSPLGIRSYIECLYSRNECMNFTKAHPIEALGRYEKKNTQGVYWTDNYNPPRKINVASGITMSTPCAFLDLAPKTGFSMPILNNITSGGALEAGVYQLTYRYKSAEGVTTEWSPLSNLVPVYEASDDNPYCEIIGSEYNVLTTTGVITNKRIEWTIDQLDTSFELIELAAVYKKDNIKANDQIFIFSELINGTTNLVTNLSGNENRIPVTDVDFLTGLGATFETVKTIDSKDNKLFFGNIENTTFVVDFDARAYRYSTANIAVLDSQSDSALTVATSGAPGTIFPNQVPEKHDCINTFNDENPATNPNWYTNDQYQFQTDGLTLGGSGINVSYKFTIEQDLGDTQMDSPNTDSAWNWFYTNDVCGVYNTSPRIACFVNPAAFSAINAFVVNPRSLGILAQNYSMNSTYNNMKSPYKYSLYGSYARGETYRFGIVFYNNKGQASFVNWIGDIKMPFSYSAGLGQPLGTFGVSSWVPDFNSPYYFTQNDNSGNSHVYGAHGQVFLNQIGLEFSIDLTNIDPEVLSGITGYSIVRSDRKDGDKTRLGTALAHTVDRINMRGEQWNTMTPAAPYSWGVNNTESVLIPSVGLCQTPCNSLGLAYMDGGTGDQCTNACWNTNTWSANDMNINPYNICQTRKSELLLYGALGWHNSDAVNTGNLAEGLESTFPIKRGDYIKNDQVYTPHYNTTMGLNNFNYPSGGSLAGYVQTRSNHWYKYYAGVTSIGGINGSTQSVMVGSIGQIDYTNGLLSNSGGQDPANNRYPLDWGTWVPDGGFVDEASVDSLQWSFMNVTNPANALYMDILDPAAGSATPMTLTYTWMWNRPQSIGSEVILVTFDTNVKGWTGADHLMGASNNGFQFVSVPTRSTFSYERYAIPYGGPTFGARTYSEYISTGNFVPINSGSNLAAPFVNSVFGGDVQCEIFDYTQFEKNWGQTGFDNADSITAFGGDPVASDAEWGMQRNCMVPLECHYRNILWRQGYHFTNKATNTGSVPNTGVSLHDEYLLNKAYDTKNDVRTYFPIPLSFSTGDEFDTRIYYSETKINGEPSDSWSVFLINNYKDVEGIHGPINKLTTLHDTMYYFQDTGFGALSVNPTAVVQGADGIALQLGTISSGAGAFIQSYQYISTQYGSSNQWAVTKSDNAIYFFDIKARKLFNYGGKGTAPISDLTGLHSYFMDNLRGDALVSDNPILKKGITSTYDVANSEALFTFHDSGYIRKYDQHIVSVVQVGATPNRIAMVTLRNIPGGKCNPCFNATCEDFAAGGYTANDLNWTIASNILINGIGPFYGTIFGKYGCDTLPMPTAPTGVLSGDVVIIIPEQWNTNVGYQPVDVNYDDLVAITDFQVANLECGIGTKSFTIAYNELIQGFTSFYDFHPSIYITTPEFLITPSTQNVCEQDPDVMGWKENKMYLHNIGKYGMFYDVIYPSTTTILSNLESAATKVFDNVSFHMESLLLSGRTRVLTNLQGVGEGRSTTGMNSGAPNIQPRDIVNNTFDQVRFYTDYQMTGYVDLTPGTNIVKKEREWQMVVPRNIMDETLVDADIFNVFNYDPTRTHKDRLRDKYMFIDLIYNNYNTDVGEPKNIKFVLHYFKTFFRPSYR
tara:strand:+ start:2675 stop:8221 length:5547 start_codon:yes stop_codon:yes gene_type:complete